MQLNPYSIGPMFLILLSFVCGTFVIIQNPKSNLNRLFLATCITFMAWFSYYIGYNFNCPDSVLIIWYRIAYCFISFIPITVFSFVTTYLKLEKNEKLFKINVAVGCLLSIVSVTTPYVVSGIFPGPPYPYPKAGALHFILVIHCIFLASNSIILCYKALKDKELTSEKRNQIRYMMTAIAVLSIGAVDFIFNYVGPKIEIGFFAVPGYLLITTVAIIKHRLMDIRIVFRKSLVYTVLITTLALSYFVTVYFAEHVLETAFSYHSVFISIFFATMVAIMFIPVKEFLERYLFSKSLGHTIEENDHLKEELTKSEKYKIVAQLTSSIAHEIKNPLTILTALTESLKDKYSDPKFVKKYEKIAGEEIERLNLMVQDFLAFGRPSPPQMERINTTSTIKSLLGMVKRKLNLEKVKLVENYNTNVEIMADPNQFKQALLNLILNAIDAMPNGGILTIRTDVIKNSFIVSVSDTGCGIDPKDQEHLFEPFFTRKKDGTGLGLAITQGIVEKHRGRIAVRSRLGEGTTFEINLNQNSLN